MGQPQGQRPLTTTHATPAERAALGVAARVTTPLSAHAGFELHPDRPDPVELLQQEDESRVPELVPIRHARMLASPFTFYRATASLMAADLGPQPTSGFSVQTCGDAHLSNFGLFGSPERRLMFDLNDFDETYPGPWEWDVKRLACSLVLAARENGFDAELGRKATRAAVARYRAVMATLAGMRELEVWYSRVDIDELTARLGDQLTKGQRKKLGKASAKARSRDSLRALAKLTHVVDGRRRFVSDPPLLVPVGDLLPERDRAELETWAGELLDRYSSTLRPDVAHLVKRFEFVDLARKVVGVGSVGTRCWVALLQGRDGDDPLLLQVKEAGPSALAPYVEGPAYESEGQRVVRGQRLMQAAGDMFLGWDTVEGIDGIRRDFYFRQLLDWKGSVDVGAMIPEGLRMYGEVCAWTLARAHARSGDRIAISAYLGESDEFERAVTSFAELYADQMERDHATLVEAGRTGAIEVAATS